MNYSAILTKKLQGDYPAKNIFGAIALLGKVELMLIEKNADIQRQNGGAICLKIRHFMIIYISLQK